jgi:regulator of RNase E activity RraB
MRDVRVRKLHLLFVLWLFLLLVSSCTNLGLTSTDQDALDNLREAGSDFSKVHPFDFYIYHPNKQGAEDICAGLAVKGFQVETRVATAGGEWLCFASLEILPTLENLSQQEQIFTELINTYGGEYDGWETIVIP